MPWQGVIVVPGSGVQETVVLSAYPGAGTQLLLNTAPQYFEEQVRAPSLSPPLSEKREIHQKSRTRILIFRIWGCLGL
jgi:hypothetical protein